MSLWRVIASLALACALCISPVVADPSVDTPTVAETAEPGTDVAKAVAFPDDPTSAGVPEAFNDRAEFRSGPGEFTVKLSFTEALDGRRLQLERFSAGITLDPWDASSQESVDIASWLIGGDRGWGQQGRTQEETVADMFNVLGTTVPIGLTVGLLAADTPSERHLGQQAANALAATTAATELLKMVVESPRPAEPNNLNGFPSGHTSMSMAFARVIAQEDRGWGTVAYLWAGGVGWSRVRRGDHTPEQVMAGALLGWLVADAVIDWDDTPGIRTPRGGGPMIPAGSTRW